QPGRADPRVRDRPDRRTGYTGWLSWGAPRWLQWGRFIAASRAAIQRVCSAPGRAAAVDEGLRECVHIAGCRRDSVKFRRKFGGRGLRGNCEARMINLDLNRIALPLAAVLALGSLAAAQQPNAPSPAAAPAKPKSA